MADELPTHKHFLITFPSDLSSELVTNWLTVIGGMVPVRPEQPFGVAPALVLETWRTARELSFRLRVPLAQSHFVVDQLRVHIPGINVVPEPKPPQYDWTSIVELGTRSREHTLHAIEPDVLAASILTSMRAQHDEIVLWQLVISPAAPRRAPERRPVRARHHQQFVVWEDLNRESNDDLHDRRKKLGLPANWQAVLRLAVQADSDERAEQLMMPVRNALRALRTPANGLYRRRVVRAGALEQRTADGAALRTMPAMLSVSELAGLMAWPCGQPAIAGLPQSATRHLMPTEAIPRRGAVLMRADYPGMMRPLCITPEDLGLHALLVGRTGTGKTTLAVDLAAQLVDQGHGLVAVETKGDGLQTFHDEFLRRIPKHRMNDVIIIDVADQQYATAYNLLDDGNPQIAVEGICSLFDHLYGSTQSIYAREALYMGLTTLASVPGHTFVDLPVLFNPRNTNEAAWRDEVVQAVQDPELRDFWRRHLKERPKAEQARFVQPLLDRVWVLNARKEIRRIFGQSKSSFNMRRALEANKIVLINLSGVGEVTAELAGVLLVNQLWTAIKSARPRRKNFMILDEWQSLLNLPVKLDDLLAKMRSFETGALLTTQNLSLVQPHLRSAVLANTATKVVFTVGGDDARLFAREFGAGLVDEDLLNLQRYQAIARIAAAGRSSSPVTGITMPPSRPTGIAGYLRWYSRKHYGKPIAAVDAEIRNRYVPKNQPPKAARPTIGSQTWE